MLLNEFIELTNVEVSNEEFYAINLVYMNCDVDKFQFCKMWCKMNASRVKAAKEAKKAAEAEADDKWAVSNIYWYLYHTLSFTEKTDKMFEEVATALSLKKVQKAGINTNDYAISVLYDIAKYLGINND